MTTVIISMTRKCAPVQRVLVIILLEVTIYADAHTGTGIFYRSGRRCFYRGRQVAAVNRNVHEASQNLPEQALKDVIF